MDGWHYVFYIQGNVKYRVKMSILWFLDHFICEVLLDLHFPLLTMEN